MEWNGSTLTINGSLETSDFRWTTLFESIDGYATGGTGTDVISSIVQGVSLATGSVTDNTAYVRKYLSNLSGQFTWDKKRRIRLGVTFDNNTNQLCFLNSGYNSTTSLDGENKIGFYVNDDTLYGISCDGSVASQTALITGFTAGQLYKLEARLYPDDRCEFYVDDVFQRMLTSAGGDAIPSGIDYSENLLNTAIKTEENVSKGMDIAFWDFWQEY
jgi:hypothetical protein